jgi:DNA repair protein RecO (recombination protein O)
MRHKYETRGIVLSRSSVGEANSLVTIITPSLGLVRARAQGVRKSGTKLAASLATFTESEMVLVRGKESWRVAGAVLQENWFVQMSESSRVRAARVSGLLLRFVAGEEYETRLFPIISEFFKALTTIPEDLSGAVEILAVLRILAVLGLDKGESIDESSGFTEPVLSKILENRADYVARINKGIEASGL